MDKKIQITVRPCSESDPDIIRLLKENKEGFVRREGFLYFCKDNLVFSCRDSSETVNFLELLRGKGDLPDNRNSDDIWNSILYGKAAESDMKKYGIQNNVPRCVILFRPVQGNGQKIPGEIIPLDASDILVNLQSGETALILNMKSRSPEEAFEYAAAVAETMENEGGLSCLAGIGRTADRTDRITESFSDARSAIDTGIRHNVHGRIFSWDRLMIERLSDLIPAGEAEKFRKEMISPRAEKVLTEEIMETIHVFFMNDLNLSTTARQLFIHRNTLLYRMEKVRKATGLDLRKFEDAVVFRMIMDTVKKTDQWPDKIKSERTEEK